MSDQLSAARPASARLSLLAKSGRPKAEGGRRSTSRRNPTVDQTVVLAERSAFGTSSGPVCGPATRLSFARAGHVVLAAQKGQHQKKHRPRTAEKVDPQEASEGPPAGAQRRLKYLTDGRSGVKYLVVD